MFEYRNNELFAENVAVRDIAAHYGTPCYLYSRAALSAHFNAYREAFGAHPHLIAYAVKANSNLAVLNVLARLGAGFDIVSGGELERVIAAGGDPAKVVFSGVAKSAAEIERALTLGIHCFNVESQAELQLINRIAGELGVRAPVSLRVNPDVDAQTHPYISTGLRENKFGIDIKAAEQMIAAPDYTHLEWLGIDCHIGSQLTDVQPFLAALERVLLLVEALATRGIRLQHLDLGGGLGVRYRDEKPPAVAEYIAALLDRLADSAASELTIILEPGRSIAANAGVFITQVQALKHNGKKHFALVDGAMNDLLRPALYGAWMDIRPVVQHTQGTHDSFDIVGPVCETGDFLGQQRTLNLQPGDLLAVMGAGAYGFVMSSNYNTRPRAAEVMVDGDRHHLVRKRERLEQLWQDEQLLDT